VAKIGFSEGPFRFLPVIVCGLAFFYLVLANAFTFAALGDHAGIGKQFRGAVADDAPIVGTWILLGDVLRKVLPTSGNLTAEMAAAPLVERISGYPPAAVAVFFGESKSSAQARMQWQHRLAPAFLLLALIAWVRRPKTVHLVRQTRHR